jgi:hypothetical protein
MFVAGSELAVSDGSTKAEHHPVTALRVVPGDCPFAVAHQVAGATLKALLVVEQDPAVVGGHKQFCRAGVHAGTGCAASTNVGVDHDVSLRRNVEVHRLHSIIE